MKHCLGKITELLSGSANDMGITAGHPVFREQMQKETAWWSHQTAWCGNCERKMGMRHLSWWQSSFKTIILLRHASLKAELHTGYSFYVKPWWENKKTGLSSPTHVFIQCQILIISCVRWERGCERNTDAALKRCCVISIVQSLILQAEHLYLHVFSALFHTRTHIRNTLQVPKKQNRVSRSRPALVWTDCVQKELRRENTSARTGSTRAPHPEQNTGNPGRLGC